MAQPIRKRETSEPEGTEAILIRLEELHEKVDQLLARLPAPEEQDIEFAERLFPALAEAVGTEKFAASDVLAYPAVYAVAAHLNAMSLGQFLSRVEHETCSGYRLQRTRQGKRATLWSVVPVGG